LPLAHRTGGLRDTVRHLDGGEHGNGFLFENYDSNAFRWAIDQSMKFFSKDQSEKSIVVSRVMLQSVETMSSSRMICDYVSVYKAALARREE
jgi:glycogen synthase